mmetsp:Transcript_42175/g.67801  ORF Transcript_42175/g.67801 Transcript_42175/m.67801 type:complete len:288 (+) Transcript_42175:60-923(+)
MMLSRGSKRVAISILSTNKRSFFDYIRVANEVDAGQSLDEIASNMTKESDTKESASFGWQWLEWFQQNAPEKYAEYASNRSQFQRWEQYLGERGVKTSKKISFEDYKKRIADASFVDDLEVNYYVERDTISSIENMQTLNSWPSSSVASFQQNCEKNGDLIVKPLTEEDKQRQKETLENAELYDEKMKLMAQEILKDFEQIDAERMMLGQETFLMELSQHPQFAEAMEDTYTAKQNYLDYAMLPIHRDYVKREKLNAIQDEERRKAFLERFEYGTKIYNGMDCSVPP